jgi:hypothetical protein
LQKRIIKCVWRCKNLEKGRTDDTTIDNLIGEINDMANIDDDYPIYLRPKYWRDQQRGALSIFLAILYMRDIWSLSSLWF